MYVVRSFNFRLVFNIFEKNSSQNKLNGPKNFTFKGVISLHFWTFFMRNRKLNSTYLCLSAEIALVLCLILIPLIILGGDPSMFFKIWSDRSDPRDHQRREPVSRTAQASKQPHRWHRRHADTAFEKLRLLACFVCFVLAGICSQNSQNLTDLA